MRRVALIHNPVSGQSFFRRAKALKRAVELLRARGIEVDELETDGPGSARKLARAAMRNGYDTILACGGDGTVHEVLQSLVGTDVALGVVPLGTANALAQDLGLSKSPVNAVRKLLDATPTKIPVGRIFYHEKNGAERSCFFTVAAGIGADALLMASLDAEMKRRFGYVLYLIEATRIWATNPFPLFHALFTLKASREKREADVSQLLAVRVRSFGGALRTLAPGATLRSEALSLIAFKTRSRVRYLRFLLAVLAARHTFSGDVELLEASAVECRPRDGSKKPIYVEADGEVLGVLPARMEIAPETLTLLIPSDAQP
ncbi:MAG TPA: diacylglycerol kinase family protein [Terracidiphilus sp.]|jgi:YegS/Rv2252/BmrU family lipid kinase|nr:diacylglycerol kinase family protein [Terracidiphilus sp.]